MCSFTDFLKLKQCIQLYKIQNNKNHKKIIKRIFFFSGRLHKVATFIFEKLSFLRKTYNNKKK